MLVVPGGYYLTMQPKWQTVYYYFRRWQKEGVWQKIHDSLRAEVRVQAGRNVEPSAAISEAGTA